MTSPKHARERYSSLTPDISLRLRESSQQVESGGAAPPAKRPKFTGRAEPDEEPVGNEYAVLTKQEEVDNKENFGLESHMGATQKVASHPGDIEVIDLLDDGEDNEEAELHLTQKRAVTKPEAEGHLQTVFGGDPSVGSARHGIVPRGIKVKSRSKDKGKASEEDEINETANYLRHNAMPDLNDEETSWMDQVIHSRPSGNGVVNRPEVDSQGNVQLTQEEIMNYLSNLENRPGHVKHRRRLVKAKDLHREDREAVKAEDAAMGESSVGTGTSVGPGPNLQEVRPDEHEEDVDPVQEEKDRVIEAARRLGCKRKKKLVTRREEILDNTVPDVQEAEAIAEGEKFKPKPEDIVIVAEGPDGRPRRYRRVKEFKTFWTVPGMTTPLLDHQILGVDWMVNDKELAEKGVQGGLVADMMGLGKILAEVIQTMQAIATMVLNKPPADSGPRDPRVTLIVAPTALLEQWKEEIEQHTVEGTFDVFIHHGNNKIKSVQHLKNQDVVITSYHTIMHSHPKTKRPSREMTKEEVEEWWDEQWETRKDFHRIRFWRVILDECHSIKNYRARTSTACTSLRAVHKWAISGTPIQNSLFDMYPIFRFLGNRFNELPVFKSIFGITRSNGAARAAKAMQVELAHIMMRRNKEDMLCGRKLLDLPPKVISVTEVEFSQEERQLYGVVEAKTIQQVNDFRRNAGGENEFYLYALVLLMRLRQICNHPYLIMDAIKKDFSIDDIKAALEQEAVKPPIKEPNEEEDFPEDIMGAISQHRPAAGANSGLRQILRIAQTEAAGGSGQCSICMDVPEDPVMTNCRHVFCQGCITTIIQQAAMNDGDGAKCPSCQREITDQELRTYLPKPEEVDGSGESLNNRHWMDQVKTLMPSAKMTALMEQLRVWKETHPDDKIIIFSQFTKMLDLVDLLCEEAGHETVSYTGGASLKQREEALKRFKHDPDCNIMLISLRAGGVGLNLTQANLVISIDMWWNAAVEHQAFDRVHRLGQTKEVIVQRLVVKDTVEQRIRSLQEMKLKVAAAAMGEGLGKVTKLGVRELMGLFGRVIRGEDGIDMVIQDH